jgi:glutaminyl-peptide cyclotransferase
MFTKTFQRLAYLIAQWTIVLFGGIAFITFSSTTSTTSQSSAQSGSGEPPKYTYQIVRVYPHDRGAFTQGLIYLDGYLYESTGLYGQSSLRKVQLETGKVLQWHHLARGHFGEGLTAWGLSLLQLTWRSNVGFVYDRATFRARQTFAYPGEGWGLTHDGAKLIMSDGTATLRFLDPQSFQELGHLKVREGESPIANLNELEYIRGEIYANIWQTDRVARISPQTGQIVGWIDLGGLLNEADMATSVDVLNGIAYDSEKDRLFVTGKLWPKLFEISVVPRR